MKDILQHKDTAFQVLLRQLTQVRVLNMAVSDRQHVARHMVVLSTWWLSYAYVLNPRQALEESNATHAMVESGLSMMMLWKPYATPKILPHLLRLLKQTSAT